MDPAEAVLQEKALKFMVRRRCRPGKTVETAALAASLGLGPAPPSCRRKRQLIPGLRPAAGAAVGTGRDGTGAPGRREGVAGHTGVGGSSSAILWRGQVTAGAESGRGASGGARGSLRERGVGTVREKPRTPRAATWRGRPQVLLWVSALRVRRRGWGCSWSGGAGRGVGGDAGDARGRRRARSIGGSVISAPGKPGCPGMWSFCRTVRETLSPGCNAAWPNSCFEKLCKGGGLA